MKRRLSILLALVFLFTAVIGASGVAVYAAEDENRIAGDDRYETAAKIATAKYTSTDTVIIVRGDDNEKKEPEVVDGLTASVLAGAKNAPILLTRQNALPDATKEAIEALGAKNAYIIGGTVAVSEDVEKALEELGVTVTRKEGVDRFATAVEVAKEANTGAKTAIVTQGFALVDSLVAGPLAYVKGYPILLVRENEVVEATEKAIKDLGIENIIIVGGEAVVSKDVEKALDELVTGSVKRLGGGDRVETSLLLADELDADEVALVNGWTFVDAVPASVLGLPILYVRQNKIDDDVLDYVGTKAGVKVIGGKVAVSDNVLEDVLDAVKLTVEVSADNLKEVVVKFNKPIDEDTVIDDNFKIKDVESTAVLEKDGRTVVLTIKGAAYLENQKEYTLTIENVKTVDGREIEKIEKKFVVFDAELPKAEKIAVTGPRSFEVEFSEPVVAGVGSVEVKSVNTSLGSSVTTDGTRKASIQVYSDLEDGKTYEVTVKGFRDYAGYPNVNRTFVVTYEKDETPPVANVVKAEQDYVVVEFNKPVKGLDKDYFYHTFTAWKAVKIEDGNGNAIDPDKAYTKVYVYFYGEGINHALPEGTVKFGILGDNIKDNWGNKLGDQIFYITVSADKTALEVTEIEVVGEDELKVKFNKKIKEFGNDNVEILDKDGKKIDGLTYNATKDSDGKSATIELSKKMPGTVVTVNIKNVVDDTLAETKITLYSKLVEIVDKTPPSVTDIYKGNKVLYVKYSEAVDAESALKASNYMLVNDNGEEVIILTETPTFDGDNTRVKLPLTDAQNKKITEDTTVQIVNVKDLAGNTIIGKQNAITYTLDKDNIVKVESIEAVAKDKLVVKFNDRLSNVTKDAFEIIRNVDAKGTYTEDNVYPSEKITLTQKEEKGVTVLEFAFDDKIIAADAENIGFAVKTGKLKDSFGNVVKDLANTDEDENVWRDTDAKEVVRKVIFTSVTDKIAPSIVKDGITAVVGRVYIQFDEEIEGATVSALTFKVAGQTVERVNVAADKADKIELILKDAPIISKGTKVTQNLPLTDKRGNEATGLEGEVASVVTANMKVEVIEDTSAYPDLEGLVGDGEIVVGITVSDVQGLADNVPIRYKFIAVSNELKGETVGYIEYRGDSPEKRTLTIDENGIAYFGPAGGFTLEEIPALKTEDGILTPLFVTLDAGTYKFKLAIVSPDSQIVYTIKDLELTIKDLESTAE